MSVPNKCGDGFPRAIARPVSQFGGIGESRLSQGQIRQRSTNAVNSIGPARLGRLAGAFLTVFALGMIVTSAEAVTEGPFWKAEGKNAKLVSRGKSQDGSTKEHKNPIKLEAELLKLKSTIECKLAGVAKGSMVHSAIPTSLEAYYHDAGNAARDGSRGRCCWPRGWSSAG